jgi:lipid II:glycine glycyltransferase (peptidoglycan interpeptide bridge formation enzyme)
VEGFKPDMDPSHPLFRVYRYKAEFNPSHAWRVAGHGLVLNPVLHLTGNARDLALGAARAAKRRLQRSARPERAPEAAAP